MKKRIKRGIILTLSLVMLLSAPALAASKKQKALKSYAKYLKTHTAPVISESDYYDASYQPSSKDYVSSFFIFDLNRDKIPELFTLSDINHRYFIVRIYTWENGKMKPYKMKNGSDAVFDDYSGASGHYSFYVCRKRHIHNVWKGSTPVGFETTENVYKNAKGKLKEMKSVPQGCEEKYSFGYENTKKNRSLLKKGKIS